MEVSAGYDITYQPLPPWNHELWPDTCTLEECLIVIFFLYCNVILTLFCWYFTFSVTNLFQVLTCINQAINAASLWYFEPMTCNFSMGLCTGGSNVRQAHQQEVSTLGWRLKHKFLKCSPHCEGDLSTSCPAYGLTNVLLWLQWLLQVVGQVPTGW
jgi:hypothetical protein